MEIHAKSDASVKFNLRDVYGLSPVASRFISESVAQRKTPIAPLFPVGSHPGFLPGSKQSFSTLRAAFHIDLKVAVSYNIYRWEVLPGNTLGLNQSSITIARVHEPTNKKITGQPCLLALRTKMARVQLIRYRDFEQNSLTNDISSRCLYLWAPCPASCPFRQEFELLIWTPHGVLYPQLLYSCEAVLDKECVCLPASSGVAVVRSRQEPF